MIQKKNGITLIALIITIIVLLILAGISIRLVTGDNGVLEKANNASMKTNKEKEKEDVKLVHADELISYKEGEVNFDQFVENVKAGIRAKDWVIDLEEESDGYYVDLTVTSNIQKILLRLSGNGNGTVYDGLDENSIYSEPGIEEDMIAPVDLFDYRIITAGNGYDVGPDGLPLNEVAIRRIKPEYANGYGLNPDNYKFEFEDTHYGIVYKGKSITDTLIIPYQVEIDGELFKVTEVGLGVRGGRGLSGWSGELLVDVETIILPNTVTKLYAVYGLDTDTNYSRLKRFVFSKNITCIPNGFFHNCVNLTDFIIPDHITEVGSHAFTNCINLKNVTIPKSVLSLGERVFIYSYGLSKLNIEFDEGNIPSGWDSKWNEVSWGGDYIPEELINWGFTK